MDRFEAETVKPATDQRRAVRPIYIKAALASPVSAIAKSSHPVSRVAIGQ
jgi:hypothetical protein